MPSWSIIVTGKVQGVFYRQSAREIAIGLGITGTVMNQRDGSVKIAATGTLEQLKELAAWCKQGPRKASVESVSIEEISPLEFEDFRIIRY